MSDIRLQWAVFGADLVLTGNDVDLDDGLESAVITSLFTHRRAEAGDVLPDPNGDRRGWWGDLASPTVDGDQIGSRLWLLSREKQLPAVLVRAKEYALEALAWVVDDRVALSVDVQAEFVRPGVLGLQVSIQKPNLTPIEFRFESAWVAQAERAA